MKGKVCINNKINDFNNFVILNIVAITEPVDTIIGR